MVVPILMSLAIAEAGRPSIMIEAHKARDPVFMLISPLFASASSDAMTDCLPGFGGAPFLLGRTVP